MAFYAYGVISLICALMYSFPVFAQKLTPQEIKYIEFVSFGKLKEAREIQSLANIDPKNLSGRNIASYVFGWRPVGASGMKLDTLNYLFKELKLDPNTPYNEQGRSVYSTMCESPVANPDLFNKLLYSPAAIEQLKREFTDKMDVFHEAKSMNYPIYTAFRTYDIQLLWLLNDKGAKVDIGFNEGGSCQKTWYVNGLSFVPKPQDKDINDAAIFLTHYISRGGDLSKEVSFTRSCTGKVETLFDRALGLGALEYAKMVKHLSQFKPGTPFDTIMGEEGSGD